MGHDMKTKEDVSRELENMKNEFETMNKHLQKNNEQHNVSNKSNISLEQMKNLTEHKKIELQREVECQVGEMMEKLIKERE